MHREIPGMRHDPRLLPRAHRPIHPTYVSVSTSAQRSRLKHTSARRPQEPDALLAGKPPQQCTRTHVRRCPYTPVARRHRVGVCFFAMLRTNCMLFHQPTDRRCGTNCSLRWWTLKPGPYDWYIVLCSTPYIARSGVEAGGSAAARNNVEGSQDGAWLCLGGALTCARVLCYLWGRLTLPHAIFDLSPGDARQPARQELQAWHSASYSSSESLALLHHLSGTTTSTTVVCHHPLPLQLR